MVTGSELKESETGNMNETAHLQRRYRGFGGLLGFSLQRIDGDGGVC